MHFSSKDHLPKGPVPFTAVSNVTVTAVCLKLMDSSLPLDIFLSDIWVDNKTSTFKNHNDFLTAH